MSPPPRFRPAPPRRRRALVPALLAATLLLGACGPMAPRMRFVSSRPWGAAWAFVIEDRGRGAEVLVDGRPRQLGCNRAGREIRCELRGLFPGGHIVEVKVAGASLRRSVLIGKPWPARLAVVRARSIEEARLAAASGADAILVEGPRDPIDLGEFAEAAHDRGARLLTRNIPDAIELGGADAVVDEPLPAALKRRFPEARAYAIDRQTGERIAAALDAGDLAKATRAVDAAGLVEGKGLLGGAVALLSPHGAVLDSTALPLLSPRKKHAALRDGTANVFFAEGARLGFRLQKSRDDVALLINAADEPWSLEPPGPPVPLDVLGGQVEGDRVTVRPKDVSLLIATPAPDKMRF